MYIVKLYRDEEVSTINAETAFYFSDDNYSYITFVCPLTDNKGVNFNSFRGIDNYTLITAKNGDTELSFDQFHYCSQVSCALGDKIAWSLQFVVDKNSQNF